MSIRSEFDDELRIRIKRELYGNTLGEGFIYSCKIIVFTLFMLNVTVWSPGMIVLFLCQRIFINKAMLLMIIRVGLVMSVVNAILAYAYAGNGYLKWESFQHLFQPDAFNWISGVQDWWHLNLYFSIILWLLAIGFALLQLIISHFAPSTRLFGYGLLNIPALFTQMNPSRYLTFLQDGILGAFVFHIIKQKQFDFIGKTSMFCFAAIVMFQLMVSICGLDESMWEPYSLKNLDREEREAEERTERITQQAEAEKEEKEENDRETLKVMKEISQYLKDKKQNES